MQHAIKPQAPYADLIAEYLANGGIIKKCKPGERALKQAEINRAVREPINL